MLSVESVEQARARRPQHIGLLCAYLCFIIEEAVAFSAVAVAVDASVLNLLFLGVAAALRIVHLEDAASACVAGELANRVSSVADAALLDLFQKLNEM